MANESELNQRQGRGLRADHELRDDELDAVTGGTKQKPDGAAAGNVAAKWNLAQGAAA
jgi:hypothetical protein